MKGSDYMAVGLTFVTGFFIGFYLYVMSFAPAYEQTDAPLTSVASTTFELSGEMYGGCNRAYVQCNHFTLKADRSYTYQRAYARGETPPDAVTGRLAPSTFAELKKQVAASDLTALQEPGGRCQSAVDGVDYRYRLIYQGTEYPLDTCGTQFGESALAQDFAALWPQVATSTTWIDDLSHFSLTDFLQQQLRKRFQY